MKGGEIMSEFIAQMLGLIIVLTVFTFVKGAAQDMFDQTHYRLEQVYDETIPLSSSQD